jgi:hypothetical protein
MTTKTWRDIAKATIQQALAEAEAQGLDAEATKRHVNAAYPFGERAYFPYKVWLAEMKATFKTSKPAQSDLAKLKAWNEGKPL